MTRVIDLPAVAQVAEQTARRLGQVTSCFVASALIVAEGQGQLFHVCCRPVDELFLRAVEQRLLSSYQLCVGSSLATPNVKATVHGDLVPGPYEPPRSMLTVPILFRKRITGAAAIASVFPDVFDSVDLCKISAEAAQASASLDQLPHYPFEGDL